ncbi:MAG TPA: hypothetical protein VEU62_13070, partial [Bryobacterales bacterium]|nr:hypothetical protein [Bryobacterales bacterium]
LLETATPTRGQNLSPQLLANLPLWNGSLRNAEAFVGYMPGVNGWGETSINGSNGRAKEVEIDGASLTIPESGGVVFNFPGYEAYSEFKLVTSSFNAEYGRLGGGLELFATKSGTNDIHGSAFLNLKRDIFEAAGWSVNQNRSNPAGYRPKVRYNEEGGTAGGPVWLPKIYDGRNKTFFFFTYTKIVQPASIGVNAGETVPTSLMKQGNFSELSSPIYDPNSTALANGVSTRTPFAGNIIPKSQWSKISANILPFIPDPTSPGTQGNYQFIQQTTINDYIWSVKLDHSITSNNRIAFWFDHENQLSSIVQYWPGPLSNGLDTYQQPDNYRVNHDLVIRPTLLLHTTFGFSRTQQFWNNPLQNGFASKIGLPLSGKPDATPVIGFETDLPSPGLPGVALGGSRALPGGNTVWGMNQGKVNDGGQLNWTLHVNQQISWIRGAHQFKAGWDIRRLRTFGGNYVDWAGTNGFYYFSRAQTASPTALTTTGNAFASFLLGAADYGYSTAQPVNAGQIRYGYQGGFVQDTWRLTPRLTLDYGVRYEVPIGWYDFNGNYSTVDLNKSNPGANGLPGAMVFMGIGAGRTGQRRPYPTDFSDVGPRAGFAYRATDKTVLRGGFGTYYQTLGNGGCGCTDGFNGSFSQVSDGVNPAFNWDQGGVKPPSTFKPPPFLDPSYDNFNSVYRIGPNFGKAPRIYNWSFTIQHEFKNWLFETAYVGSRGRGLNSTVYLNQLPTGYLSLGSLLTKNILDPAVVAAGYKEPFPGFAAGWKGGATLAQALRPYPQYGDMFDANAGVGKTWYDSLQTKVEHRFGALNLTGSWVWSKSLSLMTYRQIFSQGSNVQTQDSYNINDAKTYSFMDLPHVVNLLVSYDLPVGKGRRYLGSAGRALNLVAGGWTLSGLGQYRSGGLIQIITPGNPLSGPIFAPLTKANSTGLPIRTGISATDLDPNNPNARWFNYAANSPFATAPAFNLGATSIYNSQFRNPWYRYEAISLAKSFSLWERVSFQYRANAFNPFNRTDFGGINGTIGNANFGRPTGVQVGPRAITMELRLMF